MQWRSVFFANEWHRLQVDSDEYRSAIQRTDAIVEAPMLFPDSRHSGLTCNYCGSSMRLDASTCKQCGAPA